MSTVTKAPPILTCLQAALIIATDAHKAGLPLPRNVGQMYVDDVTEAMLVFYLWNLDDLAQWSLWLEQPINTSNYLTPHGHVHSSVDGRMYDHNIRTACLYTPGDEVPS